MLRRYNLKKLCVLLTLICGIICFLAIAYYKNYNFYKDTYKLYSDDFETFESQIIALNEYIVSEIDDIKTNKKFNDDKYRGLINVYNNLEVIQNMYSIKIQKYATLLYHNKKESFILNNPVDITFYSDIRKYLTITSSYYNDNQYITLQQSDMKKMEIVLAVSKEILNNYEILNSNDFLLLSNKQKNIKRVTIENNLYTIMKEYTNVTKDFIE